MLGNVGGEFRDSQQNEKSGSLCVAFLQIDRFLVPIINHSVLRVEGTRVSIRRSASVSSASTGSETYTGSEMYTHVHQHDSYFACSTETMAALKVGMVSL